MLKLKELLQVTSFHHHLHYGVLIARPATMAWWTPALLVSVERISRDYAKWHHMTTLDARTLPIAGA
jgi:hypothetical protein